MESMMRDSESVRIQSKTTGNNGKRSTQRTTTTPDWLQTKNFGFMAQMTFAIVWASLFISCLKFYKLLLRIQVTTNDRCQRETSHTHSCLS